MQTANTIETTQPKKQVTRVLFVDDDPAVLNELRDATAAASGRWETAFAADGEAALTMLDAARFDVIVSDLSMPKMDGATLLKAVCERFPATARIIVSNQKEMEAALRAAPVAHQFLAKPCEPKALFVAIERATSLFGLLNNRLLVSVAGSVKNLPVLPRTYMMLREALSDPDVTIKQVVRIVEQDVSISAKILQLVNSALFGLPREVSSLQVAVGFLGLDMLQSLVLSAEVFSAFDKMPRVKGFSFEDLHTHSQLVAGVAGLIPAEPHVHQTAIVAGLLHDIGKLVLATCSAKHFERAIQGAHEENRPLHTIELELIGVSHAEVGAYLLGMWGLPAPVVEAVAHHHEPSRIPRQSLDAVAMVHVADVLAHQHPVRPLKFPLTNPEMDAELAAALGIAEHLDAWGSLTEHAAKALAKPQARKS